jgi:two-component system, LytTR family, response regulator
MKACIVDDERLAREELKWLLSQHRDVEIVGEAGTVTEALRLLPRLRPDLLFLDIQMPGRTGFDLLEALPPPHPHVVFTTAHDEFALRAFEVNALDYLMKPVHPARLAAALLKVSGLLAERENVPAVAPTPEPAGPRLTDHDRVFVRDGDRCWFVPVKSLRLLEAEGSHTRVHFDGHKPLLHRSLGMMEQRLPSRLFLRANRSQLVNLSCIATIEPWFSGALKAKLLDGLVVEFSRRQARVFRERSGL